MYERHRTGGNHLAEDVIRGRRTPKRRAHYVGLRLDEDLIRQLRREAEASGLKLSAVMRLALAEGLPRVEASRIARTVGGGQ